MGQNNSYSEVSNQEKGMPQRINNGLNLTYCV